MARRSARRGHVGKDLAERGGFRANHGIQRGEYVNGVEILPYSTRMQHLNAGLGMCIVHVYIYIYIYIYYVYIMYIYI